MATNVSGSYAYSETLREVRYGPGSVKTALPELLALFNPSNAFIVTGKSLQTKTNIVSKVEAVLKARNLHAGTFSGIGEHSPIANVHTALEQIKKSGSDIIISIGGGSPIDAAKAMIYFHQKEHGGEFLKQIAIPTTLSAAEYTTSAGFTNEKGHKSGVQAIQLAPSAVILDAELTLPTPERLWLSTGIRALDHAIESLYRPGFPLPLHALSYQAIRDLIFYLPRSKSSPQDLEVRQRLQIASWMSLWPLVQEKPTPLGLSHALGHRLGATYAIGHGITSCLTLGPVIKLKAEIASEVDKKALAGILFYLGIPSTGSIEQDVLRVGEEVESLVKRLGLHTTFKEMRVPEKDFDIIASAAKHIPQDEINVGKVREMLARL